jgi:superfamily I DNA and/or RNA helicase
VDADLGALAGDADITPPPVLPGPDISAVANELIYDRILTDGPGTDDDSALDSWYRSDWGHDSPVLLADTASTDGWVTSVSRGDKASRLNFLSATACADLAEQLLRSDRPELTPGAPARILIVSPYRPHAKLVELLLREGGLTGEVRAGTAHTFQGSEAEIVILDLVNDEPHWRVNLFTPGFDESSRRLLNVALTRARRRLIVVGDFDYNGRLSKRAFLGRELLPFLRQHPTVEALDIVPAGLAARAAKAQTAALGGKVEPNAARVVVTQQHFFSMLAGDLARARKRS